MPTTGDVQIVTTPIDYQRVAVSLTISAMKMACHESDSYDEAQQARQRECAGLSTWDIPLDAARWKQRRDDIFYIPSQHRQSILTGVEEIEQALADQSRDFLTDPEFTSLRMRLELYKKALLTRTYSP